MVHSLQVLQKQYAIVFLNNGRAFSTLVSAHTKPAVGFGAGGYWHNRSKQETEKPFVGLMFLTSDVWQD